MNKEKIISVLNEEGKLEQIEIIKYFTLKSNQKDYIIYKSLDFNTNNDILIFSAEIDEKNNEIHLKSIENKEIEAKIKKIMEEIFNGRNN